MAQTYEYIVKGNTKPAIQSNENLQDSIDGISKSTENLDKGFERTLKTSEVRIKAIGGSINLLGGAVETVVGGLGLVGIDEEVVKGFQQAAASAIAFADGSKRVFEGFKEITEARQLYQELVNSNIKVENANTAALNNNAAAATNITSAVGAAQASITQETVATNLNSISKEQNKIAVDAASKAVRDLNDEEIDLLATKLRGLGATEASIAATLADARAKGVDATATNVLTGAQNAATTSTNLLNLALKAAPWLAVATLIVSVVGFISQYVSKTKEAANTQDDLNGFLVENIKLNQDQTRAYANSISRLRVLEAIISDNTIAEKDRNKALQEAKKLIPELEKVDLKRAGAIDKIREAIGREIVALEQRAKAQAVQQKLTEAYSRQLELINEVQAEFARQGFQISEFEARAALQRTDQVGITATLAAEYQKLNRQINAGTASLVSYASATVTSNGASSKSVEITKAQTIQLDFYNTALKKANEEQSKRNKELAEETRLSLGIDEIGEGVADRFVQRQSQFPSIVGATATETKKQYETQYLQFVAFAQDLQTNLIDFLESGAGEALQTGLSTLQGLLSEYGNLQQEAIDIQLGALQRRYERDLELAGENAKLKEQITKEYEAKELEIQKGALEKQKNLRRAQVAVTTAESVISAYASTASLPPPFGLIAGTALAVAYTALGAKAIQNINATNLESGGVGSGYNNIPGGGAAFGSINLGGGATAPTSPYPTGILPGIGGGRLGAPAGVGEVQMPVRAYVLAGDIENGVAANAALNNRRRLAG